MFRDLCSVTDADTAVFIAVCAIWGAVMGYVLAHRARPWLRRHAPKIGCLAMPLIAFPAGYGAALLFPDPRTQGSECGYTPDVIFYPGYAFALTPVAMIIAFTIGCLAFSKSGNQ